MQKFVDIDEVVDMDADVKFTEILCRATQEPRLRGILISGTRSCVKDKFDFIQLNCFDDIMRQVLMGAHGCSWVCNVCAMCVSSTRLASSVAPSVAQTKCNLIFASPSPNFENQAKMQYIPFFNCGFGIAFCAKTKRIAVIGNPAVSRAACNKQRATSNVQQAACKKQCRKQRVGPRAQVILHTCVQGTAPSNRSTLYAADLAKVCENLPNYGKLLTLLCAGACLHPECGIPSSLIDIITGKELDDQERIHVGFFEKRISLMSLVEQLDWVSCEQWDAD